MDRSALLQYLDKTLRASEGQDYCPNGLQVEGRSEVHKIVTGVSACQELFDRACQAGADTVLVHHGLFWFGMPYPLTGLQYRRVSTLIKNDINLLAYHLPLDRHGELGNNSIAARALGLTDLVPFGDYKGLPIGFAGRYETPIEAQQLQDRAAAFYQQPPQSFLYGPDRVRSLAIVSGGAQRDFYKAIDQGYDAFITGEVSEWVMNLAKESGTHYLACGHYATERCGIQALGEHLAEKFSIEVEFIDVPNPT